MKRLFFVLIFILLSCESTIKYKVIEFHSNDTNVVYYTDTIRRYHTCIVFDVLAVDKNYEYYYGKYKRDTQCLCSDFIEIKLK